MRNTCYSRREFLDLQGTEEHLKACGTCREVFAQAKVFLQGLEPQLKALQPILATAEREKDLKSIDGALDSINESERLSFIIAREGITPGMIIRLCNRSKQYLFKSPNESERWLHLAEKVLELVKQQGTFIPNDVRWAEAKHLAGEGNLAVARGFIAKAHESYQEAQRIFVELGDEFQAALCARASLFTLTKMGRAFEAKRVGLEALALLREYGAKTEYLRTMINLAMMLNALSQRKRAVKILFMLRRALSVDDEYYHLVIHNLAQVQMEDGQYEKALEYVAEMVEINRAKQMQMEEARAYVIAGEIYILQDEYVEAKTKLGQAIALLTGGECPFDAALINVYNAKIQMAVGKSAESIRSLREAIRYFSSEGFVPDLIDALELWEKAQKTTSQDLAVVAQHAFNKARNFDRLTTTESMPS